MFRPYGGYRNVEKTGLRAKTTEENKKDFLRIIKKRHKTYRKNTYNRGVNINVKQ